jgi:hypothetical protein
MYARVVRFTDVDPITWPGAWPMPSPARDRPWTFPPRGVQILHDPDQRTAVVIQLFETADDMAAAEAPSTRWIRGTRRVRA